MVDDLDDTILEFYRSLGRPYDTPVWLKPKMVWHNLVPKREIVEKGHTTIARHMQKLEKGGLLQGDPDESGYYALSELGERYLKDELTDEEREEIADAISN